MAMLNPELTEAFDATGQVQVSDDDLALIFADQHANRLRHVADCAAGSSLLAEIIAALPALGGDSSLKCIETLELRRALSLLWVSSQHHSISGLLGALGNGTIYEYTS